MKKKFLVWTVVLTMVLTSFSSCFFKKEGSKPQENKQEKLEKAEEPSTKTVEKEQKVDSKEQESKKSETKERKITGHLRQRERNKQDLKQDTKSDKTDGYAEYREIITRIYNLIETDGEIGSSDADVVGIVEELPRVLESDKIPAKEAFGYLIEDLTGDGIPELVIGDRREDEFVEERTKIYALYTLVNGNPQPVPDGFPGFDYSVLPLLPFSAYEISEGKTYAVWGRFVEETDEFINHHYFEADKTEPQVSIVLFADRTVKNFKILNIQAELDEKTSDIKYKTEEIYSAQELNMRTPFVLNMTFYGLYPTKGFSYEDGGVVKRYTIEMSGKDGSLYFIKF